MLMPYLIFNNNIFVKQQRISNGKYVNEREIDKILNMLFSP